MSFAEQARADGDYPVRLTVDRYKARAPLFNRNVLRAEYTQSDARPRIAYFEYQRSIQTGFEELMTSLRGARNYQRVCALQQQEVVSLTRAVDIANDLYTASYATCPEVIIAAVFVGENDRPISRSSPSWLAGLVLECHTLLNGLALLILLEIQI